MKKVLVTGAAGSIGLNVIKFLLSEGKYEITALDLRNKKTFKKLKKYQRRINIVYGDICDIGLVDELVKNHDYIIHLAGVLPPFADFSKDNGHDIEYFGTEKIINAINNYNNKCYLIYASTTSLYDSSLAANVNEEIKPNLLTNYSYTKYITEKLIKEKLKNYTILRVPLVLNDLKDEPFMYNVKKNRVVEVSTNKDVSYAFVKAILYAKDLNKKTYNIGMGEKGIFTYNEILNNILKNYGLSFKYVLVRTFIDKDYISPVLTDSDDLDNLIHYRNDTVKNYYSRLKNRGNHRIIGKMLGKIILFFKKG